MEHRKRETGANQMLPLGVGVMGSQAKECQLQENQGRELFLEPPGIVRPGQHLYLYPIKMTIGASDQGLLIVG